MLSRFCCVVTGVLVAAVIVLGDTPCSAENWKKLAKDEDFWGELEEDYDTSSGAVMLLEEAETRVRIERGYSETKTYFTFVAAVLDPVAAQDLGEWRLIEFPGVTLGKISGNTYLRSGKKVSVKSEHVRKEKIGDVKLWNFALPQYKERCIVEVSYWQASEGWFVATEWGFGGRHPTKTSMFRLLFPAWMKDLDTQDWPQAYVVRGDVPKPKYDEEFSTDGDMISFTWEVNDIPAVSGERYMPPINETIPLIKVGATQKGYSWNAASKWYVEKYLEERLDPSSKVKELAVQVASGRGSQEARLRAIYDYVRKGIRYVDIPLTESGICPNEPDIVLRNAHGDCKDQATLMVALARALRLPADCALVRTRSKGRVDTRITDLSTFNHMIVMAQLGDKTYWLDPTAKDCPFGELPTEDQGIDVLVIKEDGSSEFVTTPLSDWKYNRTNTWTRAVLRSDGTVEAHTRMCPAGEHAAGWRNMLAGATDEDLQYYIDSRCKGATMKDWSAEGQELYGRELEIECSFEVLDYATMAQDMIIIKPTLYSEPRMCRAFLSEERRFPVRLPVMASWVDSIAIEIPEGYEIQDLPEPEELEGPIGDFKLSFSMDGNRLLCGRSFAIKTLTCGVADYPGLRDYLAEVRRLCGNGIVLNRKT